MTTAPSHPAPALTTFGIIGTGRRSKFFLRLAAALPSHFRVVGLVTRNSAATREASPDGPPIFGSMDDLLAHEKPDFVIASVPSQPKPDVIRAAVERGLPVLAETPPAAELDQLRALWQDVGTSGLVQVAEQYLLMPGHSSQLALIKTGKIGQATSVQLSETQLHHAVSIIRGLLNIDFESAKVNAKDFLAPLVHPMNFYGWTNDDSLHEMTTTLATIDFGGRMGLYDFTEFQTRNPLRTNRITVRGSRGELVDDQVTRMIDIQTPLTSTLDRRRTGDNLNMEGRDLQTIAFDGEILYRNPFMGNGLSDDDIAVSDLLRQTGAWARGEAPGPYSLAQGCQDHLISLAIEESARTGCEVVTTQEPWATSGCM